MFVHTGAKRLGVIFMCLATSLTVAGKDLYCFDVEEIERSNNTDDLARFEHSWDRIHEDGGDYSCFYDLMGKPECQVKVTCDLQFIRKVDEECSHSGAYLQVSDGSEGEKRFCGNVSFSIRSGNPKLRDMFVNVYLPVGDPGGEMKCQAACVGEGEDIESLPKNIQRRTDMRCVCGLQNKDDRIIGGEDTSLNEFPWLVALVYSGTRAAFCGGAVINDQYILTASHCIINSHKDGLEVLFHARALDGYDMNDPPWFPSDAMKESAMKTDQEERTQRLQVAKIIRNTLNIPEKNDHFDVALVKLAQRIDLGHPDAPTPICLPSPFQEQSSSDTFTVAGWGWQKADPAEANSTGTQRNLKKLENMEIWNNDDCNGLLSHYEPITYTMMCAGGDKNNGTLKTACYLDSGSPLVFQQPNWQFVLAGITSWGGTTCKNANYPVVYARVSELMQWIHFHTNDGDTKWCKDDKA